MKTRGCSFFLLLAVLAGTHNARAQGTAFTYQGQLGDGANAANGSYDMTFSLYGAATGGNPTTSVTNTATPVTNGLFTVLLNFGSGPFNGTRQWMQVGVRTNGGGSFQPLGGRQELTPTPYAIAAESVIGQIPLSQLPAQLSLFSDPGTQNFFAGQSSGTASPGGQQNVAIGPSTLNSLTSGNYNTATGTGSLGLDTTGSYNSAFGIDALALNSTGSYNTAVGGDALSFSGTTYSNTAVGYGALGLTSGNYNTAVGAWALEDAGAGYQNVAVGAGALQNNSGGTENTAVGYQALVSSTGSGNVAVGVTALQGNTTGNGNTALGSAALWVCSGTNNIGIGNGGGDNLTTGSYNIDIGNTGQSGDNNVIRIGSGQSQTFIAGNVGLGGATPQQTLSLNGGMNLDQSSLNSGGFSTALSFGSGSGEGIASDRASGNADSFGLNFFTDFNKRMTIQQQGNVGIGTANPNSLLEVAGNAYVDQNLSVGSLTIRSGADLAEPFKISAGAEIVQGAVVIIDDQNPGRLKMSDTAYDTRVAGVVSGANGIHPGIQMHQEGMIDGGQNVALSGRVYVQADATFGSIHPGDLLTTSSSPGCAMKVGDHSRAQGAILGKAMTGLNQGKGMVLVLVTLQ
jgi:hypothetical protein